MSLGMPYLGSKPLEELADLAELLAHEAQEAARLFLDAGLDRQRIEVDFDDLAGGQLRHHLIENFLGADAGELEVLLLTVFEVEGYAIATGNGADDADFGHAALLSRVLKRSCNRLVARRSWRR